MSTPQLQRLRAVPRLRVAENVSLSQYTRFGIGGPATAYVETDDETAFSAALEIVQSESAPWVVIGGGTNLIVSDHGYPGVVLRFTASTASVNGSTIEAAAGAVLQDIVDLSVSNGLARIHTMTGIPGTLGAAVYGNAGAYGHSISESVREVRFFDGKTVRTFDNAACEFTYRESVFKKNKNWIIFSTRLVLEPGNAEELSQIAGDILRTRNEKYPPTMKCAGSIFKNLLFAELPAAVQDRLPSKVIREGKVPSAWFLEQTGAKGLRVGGIQVAEYHANLIYNAGGGTAAELIAVITELKSRVQAEFGFWLEEEVQYIGFNGD